MIVSLSSQVSKEDEGKQVDSRCHRLTASFIRHRHKSDSSVPICLFYEVGMLVKAPVKWLEVT